MSVPHYAWLARKLLAKDRRSPVPPPPQERAQAIEAIAAALNERARRRRAIRWGLSALGAAAAAAAVLVGVRFAHHPTVLAESQTIAPAIVAHPAAGGASVLVSGAAAPLLEGRRLAAGSRIVTPANGRATLSFSTGTTASLGEGTDLTVGGEGGTELLRLSEGSVDLVVAKLAAGQRFLVDTPDAEVEVHGTRFRVAVAPPDPKCGAGTTTRVVVTEGVVAVRHGGIEWRLLAGDRWPNDCPAPASVPAIGAPAFVGRGAGDSVDVMSLARTPAGVGHAPRGSSLAAQNDLYEEATEAKHRGDVAGAMAAFDHLLAKYPTCPLAEAATVERMRLMRASSPGRAAALAEQYLARYPAGFARAEAEAIVSAAP
jgi:ferric-dicitrate binding protein FerR (iron transport regulator)